MTTSLSCRDGRVSSWGDYDQTTVKKHTKQEKFLAEMIEVVPRQALIGAPPKTWVVSGIPEKHQTKKCNQWYHCYVEGCAYGMKINVGVSKHTGLIR